MTVEKWGVDLQGRRPAGCARKPGKDDLPSKYSLVFFTRITGQHTDEWRVAATDSFVAIQIRAPHALAARCDVGSGETVAVPQDVAARLEKHRPGFTFIEGEGPNPEGLYAAPLDEEGEPVGEYHEVHLATDAELEHLETLVSMFHRPGQRPMVDPPVAGMVTMSPDLASAVHRGIAYPGTPVRHWSYGTAEVLQITVGLDLDNHGLIAPAIQLDMDTVAVGAEPEDDQAADADAEDGPA